LIFQKWHEQNDLNTFSHESEKRYPELDTWIRTGCYDTIPVPVKIIDIGFNAKAKTSVVPEEWLGRIFLGGEELHREMDKLRPGKPPVTYCAIYLMRLVVEEEQIPTKGPIYYIEWKDKLSSTFEKKIKKGYRYVKLEDIWVGYTDNLFQKSTKINSF
jgi:hypothetical protein